MKKILIILLLISFQLPIDNLFGQSIGRSSISAAGGTLSGGGNMISYNLGEAAVPTLVSGGNMITQGFEQPGEELHTGAVVPAICAGTSIFIPYTAIDIAPGNVFTVQLSDATGDFTNAVNIGTITGNISGSVFVPIPTTIPAGTAYRTRLVSSFPAVNGTDNGNGIIIHAAALVTIGSVANNACHGGNSGSIRAVSGTAAPTAYSFSISGPTVNTSGATSGIFTGLTAGIYTITLTTEDGCISSVGATVSEPSGTLPDISMGSDYSSNFSTGPGTENDIVYNVSEIAGNASTGDTIRIFKLAGYNFVFNPAATSINIGGTIYSLDNNRWKLDATNPLFISLVLDPAHNSTPGTLNCGQKVFVSLKLKRNTSNMSTFGLSARLRKANGETNLNNNLNTIVFTAE